MNKSWFASHNGKPDILKSFQFSHNRLPPEQDPQENKDLNSLYSKLIQNAPDPIIMLDALGYIRAVNIAAENASGYSSKELLDKHFSQVGLLAPESLPQALKEFALVLTSGKRPPFEIKIISKSGKAIFFEAHGSSIRVSSSKLFVQVIFRDLTEQKNMMRLLQDSEARYRTLAESAQDGIFIIDQDYRVQYVNPHSAAYFNARPIDLIGKSIEELFQAKDTQQFKNIQRVFETEKPYLLEEKITFPVGDVWLSTHLIPFRNPGSDKPFVMGITRDISNIKQAEQKFHLQNTALEAAANGIMITDAEGTILWANKSFADLTGYSTEEVIGKNPRILKSGHQNETYYRQLWETIRAGNVWRGEVINCRKDGSFYIEEMTITPVKERGGQTITHYIAIKEDVTERAHAQSSLQQSEERVRLLLDSTAEAICGIDIHGRCIFANTACLKLLGYSDIRELLNRNMHDLCHFKRPDGSPYLIEDCPLAQAYQNGKSGHGTEEIFWRKDGSSVPVEFWSFPINKNSQGLAAVVTFIDITERKNLEEQFLQAQKMEAIGRLAGGIAHDFNNVLTVITGYSDLIKASFLPGDARYEEMHELQEATKRAVNLTKQLLTFSRRQLVSPRALNLNDLIYNVEKMLGRLIGENIEIILRLTPDLGFSNLDSGQIEQVIFNLAVNARDAMPQGGKLILETKNVLLPKGYKGPALESREGPYVLFSITDNGQGMSEEVQKHVFEPFFTTKEKGKGTGLGLATCFGIIKQAGGFIEINSEVGKGTSFKLYFPQVEAQNEISEKEKGIKKLPPGHETILLVEDEELVRNLTVKILGQKNYKVIAVESGEKALELIKNQGTKIDLVLTDSVLPSMSGKQLADEIKKISPGIKILRTSGYASEMPGDGKSSQESIPFIQKPFSSEYLHEKIREVLYKENQHP